MDPLTQYGPQIRSQQEHGVGGQAVANAPPLVPIVVRAEGQTATSQPGTSGQQPQPQASPRRYYIGDPMQGSSDPWLQYIAQQQQRFH